MTKEECMTYKSDEKTHDLKLIHRHDFSFYWYDPETKRDSTKKKNSKSIELHINVDNIIVYFGHDLWSKARCKLYANASSLHHF